MEQETIITLRSTTDETTRWLGWTRVQFQLKIRQQSPMVPSAVPEEESVSLRSLSDKNAGLLVHIKVNPPQIMQNLGARDVKKVRPLTEEDLLTRHDIIKLGETLSQLGKLQMLSETCLSLSKCRSVNRAWWHTSDVLTVTVTCFQLC